jgi:hypothetical protein
MDADAGSGTAYNVGLYGYFSLSLFTKEIYFCDKAHTGGLAAEQSNPLP